MITVNASTTIMNEVKESTTVVDEVKESTLFMIGNAGVNNNCK